MEEEIKNLITEERWRAWHQANNIHILQEQEPTKVIRQKTPNGKTTVDPTKVVKSVSGRREIEPRDVPDEEEKTVASGLYTDNDGLTDLGKVAIKANTIWTNHLTQLVNFQAGKQLAQQLGRRLAEQADIDPGAAERIAEAVMKQVLEHLDDVASADMEKSFPGIFDRTRG